MNESMEENSEEEENILFFTIFGWLSVACCLLGMVGNCLSLLVLTKDRSACAMFVVLKALAVADGIFLVLVLSKQMIFHLHVFQDISRYLHVTNVYLTVYVIPWIQTSQTVIIWLTVIISIERYLVVCKSLSAHALCTEKKTKRYIMITIFCSFLTNLPHFFEQYVIEDNGFNNQSIKEFQPKYRGYSENPIYKYAYSYGLHSVMLFLLPLVILVFLNVKVIKVLRQRSEWIPFSGTRSSLESRRYLAGKASSNKQLYEGTITTMSLCIVIVFLICGLPDIVITTARNVFHKNESAWLIHLSAVSNFLLTLNSASNFLIYCLLGRKFRRILIRMLCDRSDDNIHHRTFRSASTFDEAALNLLTTPTRSINMDRRRTTCV